jgi:uncharacterized protein (TIGR03437 family)
VVSVFGAGLSASSEAAPAGQPGTTLGAITVAILDGAGNSYAAALYYVSPRQINLVIPADVPPGPAKLRIAAPDGPLEISIVITRLAPGLATADGSGSGVAAAQLIRVHRDGAQEPPVPAASSPAPSSVAPGDRVFLVLYGTGLRHAAEVSCSLNGQPTALLYSGPHSVYAGLDQINLEVPGDLRGAIVVNCAGDGQTSNNVRVSVE